MHQRSLPRPGASIFVVPTVLAVLIGMATPTFAQGDSPSVRTTQGDSATAAQELLRLQEELRRRTEAALETRKAQQTRLDELDAEARAARRRNDAIERQLTQQRERLAEIETKLESARQRSTEISERETKLKDSMARFLTDLEERIRAGIPWKIADRAREVVDARRLLLDERTGAASALATVARLQKEQEAVGRLTESGTLEVETERGPIAVQGFHLGLLGVIFASDDGAVVGFAAAGETLEEGLESVRSAPGASAGYLRAVDILNRRRTPELTDLHLPKLRTEEGGSR